MGQILLGGIRLLLVVQATQATMAGTVRDEWTDRPLAGVVISLTDLERVTASDAEGRYHFSAVPPGPHHLVVRLIGYAPRTLHAFVPRAGTLELDVSLRPHAIPLPAIAVRHGPIVPVRGVEPGSAPAFPDRRVTIAAVRDHPLLAEPDGFQALAGGDVVVRPESPSGIHIRGGAADHTAYLLDGIPVLSPYHAAGVFSAWNPDALAELTLSSAGPAPVSVDALAGVVAGVTRAPGRTLQTQGAVSSTHARVTVDGPLGGSGAAFLVSLRTGFPAAVAPRTEPSYLRGETGDRLATLQAPVFGGQVRLLGWDSENELSAVATATVDAGPPDTLSRNAFEWSSRSLGAEWSRSFARTVVRIRGWSATGTAAAGWTVPAAGVGLTAGRDDAGVLAAVEPRTARGSAVLGIRLVHIGTWYHLAADSTAAAPWELRSGMTVATAFADYTRALGPRLDVGVGTALGMTGRAAYWSPRARVRWRPSDGVTLSGEYARHHQFAQSLRNPESLVDNVFPVDLYVATGAAGVPAARSDQGVLAVEFRPAAGVHVEVQAYAQALADLLLAAPASGEPFAAGAFAVGSGMARGGSIEAGFGSRRVGLVASYGLQWVRYRAGEARYAPAHAATQTFETGAIVFPGATWSVRLGLVGAWGRRGTAVAGAFEWEACNLVDRGCEFAGSPIYAPDALGASALPTYLRVDLGVRKHWHVHVAGRDATLGFFGTVTNLFGRANVLTYAADPATGLPAAVTMRPRAPLVLGLDWQF